MAPQISRSVSRNQGPPPKLEPSSGLWRRSKLPPNWQASFYGGHQTFVKGNYIQYFVSREQASPLDWKFHNRVGTQSIPGVGLWILQKPEFSKWLNNPRERLLWLQSGTGNGKTHLAHLIIKYLNDLAEKAMQGGLVLFVYLEYMPSESDSQSSTRLLGSQWSLQRLLTRVLSQVEYTYAAVGGELVPPQTGLDKSDARLLEILGGVFQNYGQPVYIVFDAAELFSRQEGQVDHLLRSLLSSFPDNVKFLFTSRHIGGLAGVLAPLGGLHLEVGPTSSDLEIYVRERVRMDMREFMDFEHAIIAKVLQQTPAYPTAAILLKNLKATKSVGKLKEALARPLAAEAYYARLMHGIGQQMHDRAADADRVLGWVASGELLVDELQTLLAIEAGRRLQDLPNYFVVHPEAYFADICKGLVAVADEDAGDGVGRMVRFTNAGFRDYYQGRMKKHHFDSYATSHLLNYLEDPDGIFTRSYVANNHLTIDDMYERYPFLGYVRGHLLAFVEKEEDRLVTHLFRYFQDQDKAWFFLALNDDLPDNGDGVHYGVVAAALYNLPLLLMEFLRNRIGWRNSPYMDELLDGKSPIHHLAEFGDTSDIKGVLDSNLDFDRGDNTGRTPFSYAAGTGGLDLVMALAQSGKVDINRPDRVTGRTPLSYAAEFRSVDDYYTRKNQTRIVDFLLKQRNIDVNSRDSQGRTALSYAAELPEGEGKPEDIPLQMTIIVSLIGAPGIDRRLADNEGRTPLDYANMRRRKEAALLLTDRRVPQESPTSWLHDVMMG